MSVSKAVRPDRARRAENERAKGKPTQKPMTVLRSLARQTVFGIQTEYHVHNRTDMTLRAARPPASLAQLVQRHVNDGKRGVRSASWADLVHSSCLHFHSDILLRHTTIYAPNILRSNSLRGATRRDASRSVDSFHSTCPREQLLSSHKRFSSSISLPRPPFLCPPLSSVLDAFFKCLAVAPL